MSVSHMEPHLTIKKLGTCRNFNFSFYYAHHMSTVEGEWFLLIIEKYTKKVRIMRSHGMLRES